MRAGPAAVAAIFLMALAPPAPPAAAQCVPSPQALETDASQTDALQTDAGPSRFQAEAGILGRPGGSALAHAVGVTAIQSAEGAPLTDIVPPRAYEPYLRTPSSARPLTPDSVAPSLEARGFRQVSQVRQRGQSFLAEATGPRGERVRLVLDAASGEISGMQVIGYERRR